MLFESHSAEETFHFAETLAESCRSGLVISLRGDLGTGKTVFTKGFARGLGITETVTSPTFTIMQIYEGGRLALRHFDVYRIMDPEEMYEVGLDEYVGGDGVTLIEWADRIRELLPPDTVDITIEKDPSKGPDYRKITVDGSL